MITDQQVQQDCREGGGNTSQLIYETSITLTPKSGKDITGKLLTGISSEYGYENPQQNTSKTVSATCKKNYIP